MSLKTYVATTTLHKISTRMLRLLISELKLPVAKNQTAAQLVKGIVDCLGLANTEGGLQVIGLADAIYQKRIHARRKKQEANAKGEQEDASSDESDDDGEDVPNIPSAEMLKKLAPNEFSFVMGKLHAGDALNEEEEEAVGLGETQPTAPEHQRGRKRGRQQLRVGRHAEENSSSDREGSGPDAVPSPPPSPGSRVQAVPEPVEVPDIPETDGVAPVVVPACPLEAEPARPDANIDDATLHGFATRAAAAFRRPREDEYPAPLGCTFRKYENHVKATLPQFVFHEGKNSQTRKFGACRSFEVAHAEVAAWLDRAVNAGVV